MKIFKYALIFALKSIISKIFTLILVLVVAGILGQAFLMFAVSAIENDEVKLDVLVVNEDTNNMTEKLIKVGSRMGEIKELFNIIQVDDAKTAKQMIEDKQAIACIILPEGFLSGMTSGENIEPEILITATNTLDKYIIESLLHSLVWLMRDTQGAIYTSLDQVCEQNISIEDKVLDINLDYWRVLTNYKYTFEVRTLGYGDSLPLPLHYATTLMLYILLLSTALFQKEFMMQTQLKFYQYLYNYSTKAYLFYVAKLILLTSLYFILILACSVILGSTINLVVISCVLNVSLFLVLLQAVFFNLFKEFVSGVQVNFIVHSVFLVISGGVVPVQFFSNTIQELEKISPITQMRSLLSTGFISNNGQYIQNLILRGLNIGLIILLITLWNKNMEMEI